MIDRDTTKAVRKIAKKALELEFKSEPGKLNALGMVLLFALLVLAGAQSTVESAISTAFGDEPSGEFPWTWAIGFYVFCVLVCVFSLGFLRRLIPGGEDDDEDDDSRLD